MVQGMLWLRDWEVGKEGDARVGDIQPKIKNRAAGARFQLMKRGRCSISVEGTEMVRGTLRLRGWEVGNEQGARVGEIRPETRNRATGARFGWWHAAGGWVV